MGVSETTGSSRDCVDWGMRSVSAACVGASGSVRTWDAAYPRALFAWGWPRHQAVRIDAMPEPMDPWPSTGSSFYLLIARPMQPGFGGSGPAGHRGAIPPYE